MEAWSYAQYAGETDREKHTEKTLFQNNALTQENVHVCVFNAHFYTSPYKD